MGVRIEKKLVVYDSIMGLGVAPDFAKERLRQYIAGHPFPSDLAYNETDLLIDGSSSDVWFLPNGTSEAVQEWIIQMLNDLL